MKRRLLGVVLACLGGLASRVSAQDSQAFDKIFLGPSGCVVSTGSGAPSAGATCDRYTDTSTGDFYVRTSDGSWHKINTYGTVTSVGLSLPSAFSVTGTPVTTSGSLTATWASPGSNAVLYSASGTPAFSSTPTLTSLTATSSVSTPTVTNSGNLTLSPTGNVVLGPSGASVLPNAGYTQNLGALTNKYLTLHAAELWVETLVAQNTMATIGGRVLVAPTNILSADLTAAATTITVKYNNLSNGDRVRLEANGAVEWMAITSAAGGSAGAYTYTVTRDLDGSGANTWSAGDAVLDTGTTGKGFIDLYSLSGVISGSGPTIVGNVRTGTAYNAISPRWAIGNLNGLYGYATELYGAAFGDPSGAWIKIDTTNGVRIGYNTTTKTQIDASGNASFQSGGTIIDQNGIRVTPSTTSGSYTASAAYGFGMSNSSTLGLVGSQLATGEPDATIYAVWGGAGNKQSSVGLFASGAGAGGLGPARIDVISPGGSTSTSKVQIEAGIFNVIPNTVGGGSLTATISGALIAQGGDLSVKSSGGSSTYFNVSSSTGRIDVLTTATLAASITVPDAGGYWQWRRAASGTFGYVGSSVSISGNGASTDMEVYGAANLFLQGVTAMNYRAGTSGHNFYISNTLVQQIDGNGDWRPDTDNARRVGLPSFRYTLIRGVTITSGDLQFENGWTVTESFKAGIAEEGLAFLDENDELVAVMTKTGFKFKGGAGPADVDGQPYVKTTNAERSQMDRHPEQRLKVVSTPRKNADGSPVLDRVGQPVMDRTEAPKSAADVLPLPDPKTGQTNAQRKAAALKVGGQQ